jgi:beta-lactamase regulating signal transducer with metallopeptidase domain
MTAIDAAVVDALGWALVHFAWQGALCAGMLAALDIALRRGPARLRYAMAAATLFAMALLPPLTALATLPGRGQRPGTVAVSLPAARTDAVGVPAVVMPLPAAPARIALREQVAKALPAVVGVWCAGVLLLSLRFLGGWRLVQRMGRSALPIGDAETLRRFTMLTRRMRVSRPVRLLESALVEVPTVAGWLRPAILLPAATLVGLSPEQLEAVLAHELAHVRRHDYLASLLQGAVETLLFYHPAVWWVSQRMRVERELCCDDEAVAACGDPIEYARALADLEALRPAPTWAPAATGGRLFERIARLVSAPAAHGARPSRFAAAILALAGMALAATGGLSLRAFAEQSAGETGKASGSAAPAATPASPKPAAARPAGPRRQPAAGATSSTVTPAPTGDAAPGAAARPVPVERLMELASAGVTPEYIDDLAALGYPSVSWDELISLRSQGVTPQYVKGLRETGYTGLSPDQLVALRSQGVTPDYVRGLADARLRDLSISELVELRSQGVSPDYVRGLRAAGYEDLSVTDLLGARSNGVSPADAAALRAMGYTDLSLGRLVGLRTQGVTAEYVRGLQSHGYRSLSVPMLIGLRSQGVSLEYIRGLKELGYSGLAAGELIELRSQGVTPEFVRELKEAGYDRLSTRELIDLRSHGVDAARLKRLKARGEGTR